MSKSNVGKIGWIDLTVEDGEGLKAFYQSVVGWKTDPVSMGDYNDHCMIPPSETDPVAGICHAKDGNEGLPAQWLLYITVENLQDSLRQSEALGGKLIRDIRTLAGGAYAVIQDPSGAVCALFQEGD